MTKRTPTADGARLRLSGRCAVRLAANFRRYNVLSPRCRSWSAVLWSGMLDGHQMRYIEPRRQTGTLRSRSTVLRSRKDLTFNVPPGSRIRTVIKSHTMLAPPQLAVDSLGLSKSTAAMPAAGPIASLVKLASRHDGRAEI